MKKENKHKRAIVTFANERNNYMKGLARLSDSLRNNFDGDLIAFTNEATLECDSHDVNPYAFKVAAIQKALEAGYEQILWLDCSVYAVGNLEPVFEMIEQNGMVFQDAGHMLGNWCNDETLDYFEVSREEAMNIRMIGNAGFLGIDHTNSDAMEFFRQWKQSMEDGMFKGSWDDHRHDMSCSSAILYDMGWLHIALPSDQILHYGATEFDKPLNDSIILKANGL